MTAGSVKTVAPGLATATPARPLLLDSLLSPFIGVVLRAQLGTVGEEAERGDAP
jgi:hypothetical protein